MIVCPNAKINIGLDVVRRRPDGYHDIESLFVPVYSLRDVLEVVKAPEAQMHVYGTPCDVPAEKNLCFKALRAMQERYGIGNAAIHLYKQIPMGAGLGGGSSDAAFTLLALNEVFSLGLSKEQLAAVAAEIGSDCPFFVYNAPRLASGRGEVLEPFPLNLKGYHIKVVTPGIHISTAEAYAGVDAIKFPEAVLHGDDSPALNNSGGALRKPSICGCTRRRSGPGAVEGGAQRRPLAERLAAGIETWRETVFNDFELYAFEKHPELAAAKQALFDQGAVYVSMTGSGSALFGIFQNP